MTPEDDRLARYLYVSCLVDEETCRSCREWDGREFATLDETREQFPDGANKDCLHNCRCTLVAVGDEV